MSQYPSPNLITIFAVSSQKVLKLLKVHEAPLQVRLKEHDDRPIPGITPDTLENAHAFKYFLSLKKQQRKVYCFLSGAQKCTKKCA